MPLYLTASFLIFSRPTEAKIGLLMKQMGLTKEQVEACIEADPSPNQTDYVTWLARWLRKGMITLPEDSQRMKELLSSFTTQKRQPTFQGNKDVNAYTPAQLSEVVEKNALTVIRGKDLKKLRDLPGVGVVAQKGDLTIFKTQNPDALMILSDSTDWCTRWNNNAKYYMKKGPSYVAFYKGMPYAQLHASSDQFMDRRDEPLYERFKERNRGGWGKSAWKVVGVAITDPVALEILSFLKPIDPAVKEWADKHISTDIETLKHQLRYSVGENQVKLRLLTGEPLTELEESRLRDISPRTLERYANKFHPQGRWAPLEAAILTTRQFFEGIEYAKNRVKGRWPAIEKKLLASAGRSNDGAELAVKYTEEVVKGRWSALEKRINTNVGNSSLAKLAIDYAIKVLKKAWSQVPDVQLVLDFYGREEEKVCRPEQVIATYDTGPEAIKYAKHFGMKEWPLLKRQMKGKKQYFNLIDYLVEVEGGKRDQFLEKTILDPEPEKINFGYVDKNRLGSRYAEVILKQRWPEYEQRLLNDVAKKRDSPTGYSPYRFYREDQGGATYPNYLLVYISDIIKGRWPEYEQALIDRYQNSPDKWEDNQELIYEYLNILNRIGSKVKEFPEGWKVVHETLPPTWPEGEKRFASRDSGYETHLQTTLEHYIKTLQTTVNEKNRWNEKYDAYTCSETAARYISFLRKHGGDWPEGAKLVNRMADELKDAPYSEALAYRISSHRLLRRARL